MNEVKTLDSDSVLSCQGCWEDIAADEPKVIIGARLYDSQRLFIFHELCWRCSPPSFIDRFLREVRHERS